jgi:D-alanine-D-alanine ligase
MLLEEYIDGIEITVPILDGKALSIIEIQPPKNGVFDYDNKYNGKSIELCPPSNLDPVKQIDAKNLGEMINEKLGCRHLSRVDIIFASNKFYVLEVNTMPGLTSQSLYPKAAIADGMSFNDLVLKFVELTLRRD